MSYALFTTSRRRTARSVESTAHTPRLVVVVAPSAVSVGAAPLIGAAAANVPLVAAGVEDVPKASAAVVMTVAVGPSTPDQIFGWAHCHRGTPAHGRHGQSSTNYTLSVDGLRCRSRLRSSAAFQAHHRTFKAVRS